MRLALVLLAAPIVLLATTASARPSSKPPRAEFDATVVSIGTAPEFLCGIMMAVQPVEIDVTKVTAGSIKRARTTLSVLTCFGGHLLRPIRKDSGLFELDPAKLRVGSRIRVSAEDLVPNRGQWFTTVDKIAVIQR